MPSGVPELEGLRFTLRPQPSGLKIDHAKLKWISTQKELLSLAQRLEAIAAFAIDTETGAAIDAATGLPTSNESLDAHLSLIQIAVSEDEIYLLDVVELSREDSTPSNNCLEPLRNVLSDPTVEKIIHYSPFELEQFSRYGITLAGIYDTCVQARQFRPDLPSYNLAACLKEFCDIQLSKESQNAPWMQRPLKPEWIEYAAKDPLATLLLRRKLAELELRLSAFATKNLSDAIDTLPQLYQRALEQIRPIASDYFSLRLREKNLRSAIKLRLQKLSKITGDSTEVILFEDASDRAFAQRQRSYTVDFEKLKKLHPQAHQQLLKRSVSIDALRETLISAHYLMSSSEVEDVYSKVFELQEELQIGAFTPGYDGFYPFARLSGREELKLYFGERISDAARLFREARDMAAEFRPDLKCYGVFATIFEICHERLLVNPRSSDDYLSNFEKLESVHRFLTDKVSDAQVDFKHWSVSEMCAALIRTAQQRLELLKTNNIGEEYWLLIAASERLEEFIKFTALETGRHEGVLDLNTKHDASITLKVAQRREVSPQKLELNYPEIYSELLKKSVSLDEMRAFFRSNGLSLGETEIVMDALIAGEYTQRWRVRINPDYKSLYT